MWRTAGTAGSCRQGPAVESSTTPAPFCSPSLRTLGSHSAVAELLLCCRRRGSVPTPSRPAPAAAAPPAVRRLLLQGSLRRRERAVEGELLLGPTRRRLVSSSAAWGREVARAGCGGLGGRRRQRPRSHCPAPAAACGGGHWVPPRVLFTDSPVELRRDAADAGASGRGPVRLLPQDIPGEPVDDNSAKGQ